jgi:hypothetical protein
MIMETGRHSSPGSTGPRPCACSRSAMSSDVADRSLRPKIALVENSWQTTLGMPSFTLQGDQVIRLPFIVSTSYGREILVFLPP